MKHKRLIYARFTGEEIFMEQGRLLFSLLHVFSSAGYKIRLHNNLGHKSLDKYGQLIYSIEDLDLVEEPPGKPEDFLFLYDKEDRSLAKSPWQKKLEVRFDLFSPFWFSNPIIMPFPMHPLHSGTRLDQLEKHRASRRTIRIFFSGDTQDYRRSWVRYPKPKLPRLQIVDTIKERMGADLLVVHDSAALREVQDAAYTRKVVITASSEVRIEFQDWLATLAGADFFLSPPGIIMPMCHNIIEAMAVGTIPITNYPEWLDPPLKHLDNCVVFDDDNDLIAKLKLALEMDPSEIARIRTNVLNYYEAYLRPATFVRRIEASPDPWIPILMYTERNAKMNHSKLGKHSILMQGTIIPRPGNGLKRIATSLLK
jgi:glycosyltransferase involved in cell wall biosynthesis